MPEKCARCGSDKVMEDVHLNTGYTPGERMGFPRQRLEAHVHKNPNAWVFKGTVFAVLRARICGGCGHTEIYTPDFEKLYEAYQRPQGG